MDDFDEYDDENYGLDKEDDELYDDGYDSDDEDNYDDDLDDDLDDEESSDDDGYHDASYYEALGIDDGRFDREHHMLPHSGFGSSVDLEELDDDQREAYELGYGIGAEDYDLKSDE
ncbi:hypothetical protein IKG41_01590 [Candidatus Saccharibacteria bacterium]|nr:hypothetical protein [Candidatus Saccharibacteria bacterium]